MNYKKLSLLLTGLVMILGTTTAFAVWDTLSDTESGNTIEIGEGLDLAASASVTVGDWLGTDQLVPTSGVVLQDGDVTSAVAVYDVAFTGNLIASLELDVTYSNLLVGGVNTFNSLVTIVFNWSYTNSNFTGVFDDNDLTHADSALPDFYDSATPATRSNVYIQITVTISEPSNSSEYTGIAAQNITFDLNFLAA
ncbi:MAG: hypothetical protein ACO207_02785 [Bacilli bacterium]